MRLPVAIATCVAIFTPLPVSAQEMATIDSFIAQNASSTNGSTEVFVGLRCSSLFALMKIYLTQNDKKDMAQGFAKSSETALEFAYKNHTPKDNGYLLGQYKFMIEGYKSRFLKSKALTGNFSDDFIISSDLNT